jgi:cyclophilin family peptidyl-prolyl cis-trans isomerase
MMTHPAIVHRTLRFLSIATMLMIAAPARAQAPSPGAPPAGAKPQTPATQPAPEPQPLEYALMTTSKGDIVLELDREHAPVSVENFLAYVEKGFYDGTIFHRVMPQFMIQGGGFTADMHQKDTDAPIKNEWKNGLINTRGTLAMARTAAPDSATAQFFINVVDNPSLDKAISGGAGYAVFGKVIAGMNVVDEIRMAPTGRHGPHSDVPTQPITIESVKRLTSEQARKLAGGTASPGAPGAPAAPDSPSPPPTTPPATKPGAPAGPGPR